MTSSSVSRTMNWVPSTSTIDVSGLAWIRSIRSGLTANVLSLSRVSTIIGLPSMGTAWVPSVGPRKAVSGRTIGVAGAPVSPRGGALSPLLGAPVGATRRKKRLVDEECLHATTGARRRRAPAGLVLALQVGELLQHLVGGGDDARVGLEAALGDDQVRELLGEVDVAHLESAGDDAAESRGARR